MIHHDAIRRFALLVICMLITAGVVWLYASSSRTEPDQAAAKDYVTENHIDDTQAQNAVTAVYLNYRLWDTLFESLVLLISALAVISLSWCAERTEKHHE